MVSELALAAAAGAATLAIMAAVARRDKAPGRGEAPRHGKEEEDMEDQELNTTAPADEKAGVFAPWVVYANEAKALFEQDEEVSVEYDGDGMTLTLRVDNPKKAEAIAELMPAEMQFGNVTLGIAVVPCNEDSTAEQLFRIAFDGNPALEGTVRDEVRGDTYALFAPEAVQFDSDDFASPFGLSTMTYEQISREVLSTNKAFITSDVIDGSTGDALAALSM